MRNLFNRRTVLAALVFVLAVSALAGYFAPSADALPSNEVWTEYYNNASYDILIGERAIFCSGGRYQWGSTSIHRITYSTPCF